MSHELINLLKNGPFPDTIDPWSEIGRYFQQIHSGMIENLLQQLQDPLLNLGYVVSKETSLQITEGRQPDLSVRFETAPSQQSSNWNYAEAAEAVMTPVGIAVDEPEWDLQNLTVYNLNSGDLVTIIEVISPRNKTHNNQIEAYRLRRNRHIEEGINFIEIDPTRSVKRLFQHALTERYAYHIAIFIPSDPVRIIGINFGEALSRLAVPLHAEVFPVETHDAYTAGYRTSAIAAQMNKEGFYTEKKLPFPSLLTEEQREMCLARVEAWQQELARLRGKPEGD